MKKYIVELTLDERKQLKKLVRCGKAEAYKIRHAQILLKTDQAQDRAAWKDKTIAEAYECHVTSVENIRRRFVEQGLEAALGRAKRGPQPHRRKLDGDAEATLIALACSEAPEGRSRWTVRLLADRLVELGVVDELSHMTVQRTMKKTSLSLG
jgi:hypothetical protein